MTANRSDSLSHRQKQARKEILLCDNAHGHSVEWPSTLLVAASRACRMVSRASGTLCWATIRAAQVGKYDGKWCFRFIHGQPFCMHRSQLHR
jgi:hypothetical protein